MSGSFRRILTPPVFIAFWFLINILPAGLAELTSDEGYYWFLASKLEWGYYDHPPMLALLVNLGTAIAPGEFGVRLLNVVFSTAGLALLFKMLPDDRRLQRLAYLIILSLFMLNFLAIVIFPDGPLLFFSLVFLYGYRRFLHREDTSAVLVMGVAMALMAYAKYHGALVVLFTVLSNPRLLRSKAFYAAGALALVLFLPHLWWQYLHEFVTFRYHLAGRARPPTANYLIAYLTQQVFAIGPALVFVPFVVQARDRFERALKFIAAGTLVFFLLTTLRGVVEIHWTSIALYPVIILSVHYYRERGRRLLLGMLLPFIVAGLLVRVYLVQQIIPGNNQGVDYYHDRDLWAQDIEAVAGNDAVVFFQGYKEAPLYAFYSGRTGVALFPGGDRQSQYQLWHYEDSVQNRPVTWVQRSEQSTALPTRMGKDVHYWRIPAFVSYYNLRMTAELPDTVSLARDSLPVRLVIHNHRDTPVTFPTYFGDSTAQLFARVEGATGERLVAFQRFAPDDTIPAGGSRAYTVSLPVGELGEGRYRVEFGIWAHPLGPAYNSPALTVTVTE